ncbi:protein-disulfide reductase DsbD [Amphritea sp. HPY]|uniref:protein-disulfide reductase DsbD n=1 Tax=Amphritea sp. HPY TaxID=3421652 RepID=UPI003D7EDE85
MFVTYKNSIISYFATLLSLLLITLSPVAQAGLFDNANPFSSGDGPVDVEQAFVFEYEQPTPGQLKLIWQVKDGYYLYRDKIQLSESDQLTESGRQYSPSKPKDDPLFGQVEVYYNQALVDINFSSSSDKAVDEQLTVTYQGCWDGGICYPPVTKQINLAAVPPAGSVTIVPAVVDSTDVDTTTPTNAGGSSVTRDQPIVSEQDQFARMLSSSSVLLTLGAFFVAGLALALTPCVFPMIPILSSIIAGQGHRVTAGHGFFLSLVYVLAVSVTYTIAGVIAGLFGENLQAAFQNAWIIGFFSLIFVLLSLSMFGFYDLQLPNSWQSRLNKMSNHQKGGTLMGVAVMGFLSALIVGPCMAAPLAGALIYIGQTGDPLLGGAALFSLSLGMGVPLLIVGASAGKLLPKAGGWMDSVKAGFGVMMLLLAVWMLDRVIADNVALLLYAVILLVASVHMKALDRLKDGASGWSFFWKGIGVVLMLYGGTLFIGGLTGGKSLLTPLQGVTASSGVQAAADKMSFITVTRQQELDQYLANATAKGQPVMLDFYADWCISCVELDLVTFADSGVQQSLQDFLRIKVDVTANDKESKLLNKNYSVIGPPALIFFDKTGQLKPDMTLIGVIDPQVFVKHVAILNR